MESTITELLEDGVHCDTCNLKTQTSKISGAWWKMPVVLTVQLNRFDFAKGVATKKNQE